VRIMRAKLNCV